VILQSSSLFLLPNKPKPSGIIKNRKKNFLVTIPYIVIKAAMVNSVQIYFLLIVEIVLFKAENVIKKKQRYLSLTLSLAEFALSEPLHFY